MSLYTITLSFSDHLVGLGQEEAISPEEALKQFIETSEALNSYDRKLISSVIMPLIHYKDMKGVWGFHFDPDADLSGENDNPILGGKVVQTDVDSPMRK